MHIISKNNDLVICFIVMMIMIINNIVWGYDVPGTVLNILQTLSGNLMRYV